MKWSDEAIKAGANVVGQLVYVQLADIGYQTAARLILDAASKVQFDGPIYRKEPCPVCLDRYGEWNLSNCGTCDSRGWTLVEIGDTE